LAGPHGCSLSWLVPCCWPLCCSGTQLIYSDVHDVSCAACRRYWLGHVAVPHPGWWAAAGHQHQPACDSAAHDAWRHRESTAACKLLAGVLLHLLYNSCCVLCMFGSGSEVLCCLGAVVYHAFGSLYIFMCLHRHGATLNTLSLPFGPMRIAAAVAYCAYNLQGDPLLLLGFCIVKTNHRCFRLSFYRRAPAAGWCCTMRCCCWAASS
jgi:hypothetical protein